VAQVGTLAARVCVGRGPGTPPMGVPDRWTQGDTARLRVTAAEYREHSGARRCEFRVHQQT
jgi:hypothetical protein